MNIWCSAARLLVLVAFSAGCGDDSGPADGAELGACVDGFCHAPLVCAPEDVCVDPAQLAEGTETGTTSTSGATTAGAESDASAGDSSPDEGGGEEG
ncbi:MAG: hypothetical protein ACRBN8_44165, partial [Nannocystales bacterium]